MKVLTVQQPWAWAIVIGAKTVENRTQAWKHRGDLAVHAGTRISSRGIEEVPRLMAKTGWGSEDACRSWMLTEGVETGGVLGFTDLVDVHEAQPELENDSGTGLWAAACCASPWAEQSYAEHGGTTRRDVVHLVLEDIIQLGQIIPARGRLGLWTPDADLAEELARARS